jgi:hypothetical protein
MSPQGISTAKNARTHNSSGKPMVTVFRDLEGILLIEYLKRGSTITGEVYKETIRKLKAAIQQKRPHNCDQKIVLLHENCGVHKVRQVREVIDFAAL